MTDRNRAIDVVTAAKAMAYNDAVAYVEAILKQVRLQGEQSGLEHARQTISQLAAVG